VLRKKKPHLDLASKIFEHPREDWEKILSSGILTQDELTKIWFLNQAEKSYETIKREADCARIFEMPKI